MKETPPATKYAAEFIGTFFVIFTIGCNVHTSSIGAALSVGFVLTGLVCALGSVSGAHFNPAVTLAVLASGITEMTTTSAICYVISQVLGGICGTLTYWVVLESTLQTRPAGTYSSSEAAAVEIVYSWALCYVFLNVMALEGREEQHSPSFGTSYGLPIGFTVTAALVAAGPISGCNLNPAVTLASLAVAPLTHTRETTKFVAMYTFAPCVGALMGSLSFYLVQGRSQNESSHVLVARRGGVEFQFPHVPRSQAPEATQLPPVSPKARKAKRELDPPPWSLRLSKQAFVVLPEDITSHELFCALRWRMKEQGRGTPETCDIDLSCVKFNRTGECMGGIYFTEPEDALNGIRHSGDDVMGDTGLEDNELITLQLSNVQPTVHALVFLMMIYSSEQSFDDIQQCYVRLVDATDNKRELCRYEKDFMEPGTNALIAAMLYRRGRRWCFKAIDECFALPAHSSYRKLIPQMRELLTLSTMESMEQP